MNDLGLVRPGSTIYLPFGSYASSTGAPSAMTGLALADIKVYKDGSTTERASTAGFVLLDSDGLDFDGQSCINGISIDLSDDTTADFWKAGSKYIVVIGDVTVDSQTLRFIAGTFRIGTPGAVADTHIATLSSQTSFTLNSGPAEDNALKGCVLYVHDKASAVQCAFGVVTGYTGASKTVTLAAAPTFTIAAGDNVSVLPPANVQYVAGTAQTAGDVIGSLLTAAGVRAAVGLASANIDTQLTAISSAILTAAAVRSALGMSSANLDTQLSAIAGYIDTEAAAILAAALAIKLKTDNLPGFPAATGDAMTLTSGERNSIADALLDRTNAIETGLTLRQALRLQSAAAAGKVSGAATATVTLRNAVADSKDRIVATVDSSGNRSAIVLDLT